ncbi:hypothetical protein, partial [Kineococcus glutinatus]|uniref:hypothetical protein n=1 Tax=Kineococcus glutinatus TaxID=1070872 RepID=UPI0031E5182B
MAPLAAALGDETTGRAWKLALPLSLGLQWLLRRRYLTDAEGIGRLRADGPVLRAGALACVAVPVLLCVAPERALPAALLVTWVGGLVVVVRGWGVPYALGLLAATGAMSLGVPVVVDVLLVVVFTEVAVVAAVLTSAPSASEPTPWRRSLAAGALGGASALLITLDPTVVWSSSSPFPVVALVPSLVGSLWAGHHLNRIWTVLLEALASTRLAERGARRNWRVFGGIVAGAFARLLLGTALASALAWAALRGMTTDTWGLVALLLGLGCYGVVGFLASLLESFSRLWGAAAVTAAALAASWLVVGGTTGGVLGSALAS